MVGGRPAPQCILGDVRPVVEVHKSIVEPLAAQQPFAEGEQQQVERLYQPATGALDPPDPEVGREELAEIVLVVVAVVAVAAGDLFLGWVRAAAGIEVR